MAFSLSWEVSIARFLLQRKLDSLCALSVRLFTSAPIYQIKGRHIKSIYTLFHYRDWYVHFRTQTDLNARNTKTLDWWINVYSLFKTDCAASCSCSGRRTVLRFVTPGCFLWGAPFKKSACSRGAAELWHFKNSKIECKFYSYSRQHTNNICDRLYFQNVTYLWKK